MWQAEHREGSETKERETVQAATKGQWDAQRHRRGRREVAGNKRLKTKKAEDTKRQTNRFCSPRAAPTANRRHTPPHRQRSSMVEHRFCKADVMGSIPLAGCDETPIKTGFSPLPPVTDTACLGHALGALAENVAPVDPDLAAVLTAWTNLPDPVRAGIAAIAKATPP